MLSNILSVLRDRYLIVFFFVLSLLKLSIALNLLPKRPSSMAPDEGAYGALVDWIAKGLPLQQFPVFSDSLYSNIKSFITTALVFNQLGFEGLYSVRLTSILYSLLSLIFLCALMFRFRELMVRISKGELIFPLSYVRISITVYGLIPSLFIWSILGLRETTSQFWLISAIYFSTFIWEKAIRLKIISIFFFILSVVIGFGSRQETVIILLVSMLISQMFQIRSLAKTLNFFAVVICGWILGLLFVSPLSPAFQIDATNSSKPSLTQPAVERTITQLRTVAELDAKRTANQALANSAWPSIECGETSSRLLTNVTCNLRYLPIGVTNYVFRPLIFIDSQNSLAVFASLENLIWITILLVTLFFSRKLLRSANLFETRTLFVFLIIFVAASALYEGNVGTAFRHRSSLYWVLVVLFVNSLWFLNSTKIKTRIEIQKEKNKKRNREN